MKSKIKHPPLPLPQAFGIFSCPGEREFEEKFSKNSNVQEVVGGGRGMLKLQFDRYIRQDNLKICVTDTYFFTIFPSNILKQPSVERNYLYDMF